MFKVINGMKDILPGEVEKWHFIEEIAKKIFKSYNYKEIRTPMLEVTALFKRGVGETTDIVEKEMYSFDDKDGTSLSLRPEGTACVVRSYIENNIYGSEQLTKYYYMGEMYRHERPQKGRYRAFHQIGAEYFGASSYLADAEMILMIEDLLKNLSITNYTFYINSIGCSICRPVYKNKLIEFFSSHKEHLCENCQRRLSTNPLRVLDCKNESCKKISENAPSIIDNLCEDCSKHHNNLIEKLNILKVNYKVDPKIVRGLDYYVKTTFEVRVDSSFLGSQNTILGGGRYNGLVKELGGNDVEAIGFAMGVERVLLLLSEMKFENSLDYFVIGLGEKSVDTLLKIVRKLRVKNFAVEFDPRFGSIKSQMRFANKLNAKKVIIIGENETEKNIYIEKDMLNSTQTECSLSELLNEQ